LEQPDFLLYDQATNPPLTLFEPPEWYFHSGDVIEALNNFFSGYIRARSLQLLKKKALQNLEKEKKKALGVISKSRQRLAQLDRNISYREIADIIMANLYTIPPMASEVQLPDFETGTPVSIKLKPSLSPQKNAENYYRKSKNQGKEIKVLTENLNGSQGKLAEVNDHIAFVRECTELKLLKDYCKNHRLLKSSSAPERLSPFKELSFRGFTILIGRNAANNDLLTQKYSHKDDLWLHAKDVRGSHVVIRQVPGRPYPSDVIEKAAQVAAFHSKRKHDSLCPVIYTSRKYVRKPKGAVAGEVIVERENVILVAPEAGSFSNSNFK
jgi:predicted ribosome quality control (RQC) complex YloA/Tae2 family protein